MELDLFWLAPKNSTEKPAIFGGVVRIYFDNGVQRCIQSGQFITTSAEVTPSGGLVRESPPKWP